MKPRRAGNEYSKANKRNDFLVRITSDRWISSTFEQPKESLKSIETAVKKVAVSEMMELLVVVAVPFAD